MSDRKRGYQGDIEMPRRPIKPKRMRPPRVNDSMEYKQRWIEAENKRREANGSKWRYGFSSADSECLCLLAAEEQQTPGEG